MKLGNNAIYTGGIPMKKKIDEIVNGNMTNNMEDVKWLGKQMENLRDEQQLEADGRENDPEQFDNE